MSLAFDLYLPHPSRVHRLDPRVKLALLLGSTALLLTFQNLPVCLVWLLLNQVLFMVAKVPRARVWGIWQLMLPVSALVLLTWPLVYQEGGSPWLQWGII